MSHKDPTAFINRMAADLGLSSHRPRSRMKNRLLFFRIPRNWKGIRNQFGYSPWREPDGKFYAYKYRENQKSGRLTLIKKLAFAKRKTAMKKAYQWHEKFYKNPERLAAQEIKIAAKSSKPKPTKAEIVQKKIAHCEGYIRRHSTRLKRTKTLIKKWEKKKRYYEKKARSLKERN